MNISYNRFHIITLFLSTLLFTPLYSDYHTAHMTLHFEHQGSTKDLKEPRSHHNYSHNDTWNNSRSGSAYSHSSHFKRYNAQEFREHFTHRGYTEKEILQHRCLYMFDEFVKFAQTYSSYTCTIQQLHAELKNLNIVQKIYYRIKGTYCSGLQKRIRYLHDQLNTIKTIQQQNHNSFLNDNNSPPLLDESYKRATPVLYEHSLATFPAQKAEYKTLDSTYRTYIPSLSHAIEKRLNAYNVMTRGEYLFYRATSYNLNTNVTQLLNKYGHDTTRFIQCDGNELEHAIHQESLTLLDRIDSLPRNSILHNHQEALIDFTVAMVDYNHEGLTDKAMNIGDLCWTLLDYGQAIAEGAALGVYSAASDILNNPIQATINIVAGKQVLTYQLCKVLYNVAEIGVTAISDFDHAKNKWDKYAAPLNNIIDAISKKEITIRDAIKGGTAFIVGYKAQGKLLGGLGKFCNTIRQKSINFIKSSALLNPQEYLTTPEGLLLKATAQSNKLKQSVSTNTASKLKNDVDNKVSKSAMLPAASISSKRIIRNDLRAKIQRYKEHIFSPEHERDGILTLGKDKATIMNSLHDIIVSLDQKGLLKEGPNQIKATINGINNVEIKCFIQNGEAISVNAYLSRFSRIYGNFIDATRI